MSFDARYAFGLREMSLAVAGLSLVTIAAALTLEHIGGFRPCPLCLEERIIHYVGVPAALVAFILAQRLPLLGRVIMGLLALGFVFNAGLSFFHAGVEWHWWQGPDECTGFGNIARSPGDLLKSLNAGGNVVVRCDEAPLRILGLSLAFYGGLLSVFLAAIAGTAALGIDPAGKLLTRLSGRAAA